MADLSNFQKSIEKFEYLNHKHELWSNILKILIKPFQFYSYYVPQRWNLALLMNLGFAVLFGIRCNIGAARAQHLLRDGGGAAIENASRPTSGPTDDVVLAPFLSWDHQLQGLFVSAIFYGTLTLQLPGGIICCQFSPKKIFSLSVGSTSVLNMLMPLVISWHYSAAIVVHFCQGVCFGVAFPASFQMWKFWAPPLEKSRLITTSICGSYIGVVVGMPLSALLITMVDWTAPFYAFGFLGMMWFVVWTSCTSDRPAEHRWITVKEKSHIKNSIACHVYRITRFEDIPLKKIATCKPFLAIVLCSFCRNWTLYIYIIYSLSFMHDVFGIDLRTAGLYTSLSYTLMAVVVICGGRLADYLLMKKWFTVAAVRKLFTTVGFLGEGLFLFVVGLSGNETLVVVCLILSASVSGLALSGYSVNQLDIGPTYAGFLMGVSNGLSNLSGVIGPPIIEYLTSNYGGYGWRLCFFISNVIQLCSVAIFLLWASGDEQQWSKDDGSSSSSKLQIRDEKSAGGGKESLSIPNEPNIVKYNDVNRRKSIVLA